MARRKLSQDEEAQVSALRSRMILTLRFIERVEDFPLGPQMRAIVEDAARKGDLRALRLVGRDLNEMTIALLPRDRDELEGLLRAELAIHAEAERAEVKGRVAEILKRGTVASDKERRRLEEYADWLRATGGDAAEIAAVERVLSGG